MTFPEALVYAAALVQNFEGNLAPLDAYDAVMRLRGNTCPAPHGPRDDAAARAMLAEFKQCGPMHFVECRSLLEIEAAAGGN